MFSPYKNIFTQKVVVLGSRNFILSESKDRNRLFASQLQNYQKISSTFEQDLDKKSFKTTAEYCQATVKGKIDQLTNRFQKEKYHWDILVCGDTIIDLDGQVLQKPVDYQHCVQMMSSLSNRKHKAITAHYIIVNKQVFKWVDQVQVVFGDIPKEAIQAYAKTDQPFLHSGGYQARGIAGSFITSINGNITAVQGLNLYKVCSSIIEGLKKNDWIK